MGRGGSRGSLCNRLLTYYLLTYLLTKGPGSVVVDGTNVGCASRYDDTDSPKAAVALGYTDASSYSCKLEPLQGASNYLVSIAIVSTRASSSRCKALLTT